MAVKIRLARGGAKKRPYYRIVVANATAPRDGDFIEKVGTYNPLLSKDDATRVVLKTERIKYWLGEGALPTERVVKFLMDAKVELPAHITKKVAVKKANQKKRPPKKAAEEAAEA